MLVPGHVELKSHFKVIHHINISNKADLPFRCSECGSLYDRFENFKRHMHAVHPPLDDIRQSFSQLFPFADTNPDFKGVLSKCLLYSSQKFSQVEDEYIRGYLRMLYKMPVRGLRRKADGIPSVTDTQLAWPFIRWIDPNNGSFLEEYLTTSVLEQPHIVYAAKPFAAGQLFFIINRTIHIDIRNSIYGIDTLFKTYKVFGIKVPTELCMMQDFLECVLFKTLNRSSRATVNRIAVSFREATDAEDVEISQI